MSDEKKRISTEQVLKHQWFSGVNNINEIAERYSPTRTVNDSDNNLKKQAIVEYFEKLGFTRDFVLQSMNKNLFNHIKACYDGLFKLLNV